MESLQVILIALLLQAPAREPQVIPCKPVTGRCLASLSMEPSGPEMEVADPRYLDIVARGQAVMPELIPLLSDSTPTSQLVPLFGGTWAVGDIAMSAIFDIIHDVPWMSFTSQQTRDSFEQCGFCGYWQYVRDSQRNRRALRGRFSNWYVQHVGEMTWEAHPELLSKGYYVLRSSSKTRP
jgi:hypothetical protein